MILGDKVRGEGSSSNNDCLSVLVSCCLQSVSSKREGADGDTFLELLELFVVETKKITLGPTVSWFSSRMMC